MHAVLYPGFLEGISSGPLSSSMAMLEGEETRCHHCGAPARDGNNTRLGDRRWCSAYCYRKARYLANIEQIREQKRADAKRRYHAKKAKRAC